MTKQEIIELVQEQYPTARLVSASPQGLTYEFSVVVKGEKSSRLFYEIVVPLKQVENGDYMPEEDVNDIIEWLENEPVVIGYKQI